MLTICLFYAPGVEITFDLVLNRSGRFLVKVGGVVNKSSLHNKNLKVP